MKPISEIAAGLGLAEEDVIPFGRYKAKVHGRALAARRDAPNGKLVVVSSITPTPPGDGARRAVGPERRDRMDVYGGRLGPPPSRVLGLLGSRPGADS